MNHTICVYATCFNQKDYISKCIESVLAQTRLPDEFIIIDDVSTDGSIEILQKFKNEFPELIRLVLNKTNQGISKNRNLAIELCNSTYISGIDGDDLWLPSKLEKELELLIETNADFVFSNHYTFTDNDKWETKNKSGSLDFSAYDPPNLFKATLLRQFGAALYRSELVKTATAQKIGGYDNSINLYEDYDFKIRLSKIAKGSGINEVLHGYRNVATGLSKTTIMKHYMALKYIFKKNTLALEPLSSQEQSKLRNLLLPKLTKGYLNKEISTKNLWHELSYLRKHNIKRMYNFVSACIRTHFK